jgi:hypothetical protein
MRHIDARPSGSAYDDWHSRACKERTKLIDAWKAECEAAARDQRPIVWKPNINADLYKEFRKIFLYEAFRLKCAYCEINHSDGYPVQVEHYRPKGMVTENRRAIRHPGYFWLAFEWWNLVPSCAHCNTNHTDPLGVSHPGKLNEFPVRGSRVGVPSENPDDWQAELADEQPVLLNPYFDYPEDEVGFDVTTGAAVPETVRGKETINICDLSRISLCEKRLSLRTFELRGMLFDLMDLKDIDIIAPPSIELSLWRKRLIQSHLEQMTACAHLSSKDTKSDNESP